MNINEFAQDVYDNATAKGFHDGQDTVASHVANMHSELSELWEAYREGRLYRQCDKAEKLRLHGLPELTAAEEELADVIIRALDSMMHWGIDPERALRTKHIYNTKRPRLHGNKSV